MKKLCFTVVHRADLSQGDSFFHDGEACKGLSVVIKGTLIYHHKAGPTRSVSELALVESKPGSRHPVYDTLHVWPFKHVQ